MGKQVDEEGTSKGNKFSHQLKFTFMKPNICLVGFLLVASAVEDSHKAKGKDNIVNRKINDQRRPLHLPSWSLSWTKVA